MMKDGFKYIVLALFSVVLLTACSGVKGLRNDVSETSAKIENAEMENELNDTENSSGEIDYNWWENKCYVSESTGGKFYGFRYSEGGESYFAFGTCCVPINEGKIEIFDDDYFGITFGYTFQTQMRKSNSIVYDEYYIIYYTERDRVDVANASGTYIDSFEYDSSYQLNNSDINNPIEDMVQNNFFDGQRFECFETVSGEDITLTVHLYYSDDSSTPSSYKGELSNGVEFWFELYENSSECVTYKIDCMDGTTAYLQYSPDTSEMVFTADEGTEYGNMYAYSGTYIGLPDEVAE